MPLGSDQQFGSIQKPIFNRSQSYQLTTEYQTASQYGMTRPDDVNLPGPMKRGSNLACLKCRAIKVKCWKTDSNDPRCARCNRLDLFCEFREHHRGKKLEKVIQDEDRSRYDTPEQLQRAKTKLSLCNPYPLNIDLFFYMGLQHSFESDLSYGKKSGGARASSLNVESDASTPNSSSNSVVATSIHDDVARLTQLSWHDACYLFNLFVNHLNPVLSLLDTQLHSASFTRERCPLLFSAILTASSKFFRPDVYPQCSSATDALLSLAEADRVCTLDHIQALVVQEIWCDLNDTSRPRKLVKAIGYAHELGLSFGFEKASATSSGPPINMTSPSLEQLQARTQQRTWIQLCLLELSQQVSISPAWSRRPLIAVADMPTAKSWHDSTSIKMGTNEVRLAFLLDLALGQTGYNQLADISSSAVLSQRVKELQEKEAACSDVWLTKVGEEQVFRYELDQHSRTELGFLIMMSKFARAKQIWTCATTLCRQYDQDKLAEYQEQTWFRETTTSALGTLDAFASKMLLTGLLRLSPQCLSLGCFGAVQWLLSQTARLSASSNEQAKTKITEIFRLLARPQYYPHGGRIPPTSEMHGVLNQALRSIAGSLGSSDTSISDTDDGSRSTGEERDMGDSRRSENDTRSEGATFDQDIGWARHLHQEPRYSAWSDLDASYSSHAQEYGVDIRREGTAYQPEPWQYSMSLPDLHSRLHAAPQSSQPQQYTPQVHHGFAPAAYLPAANQGLAPQSVASGVVSGSETGQMAFPYHSFQRLRDLSSSTYRSSSLPSGSSLTTSHQSHPQHTETNNPHQIQHAAALQPHEESQQEQQHPYRHSDYQQQQQQQHDRRGQDQYQLLDSNLAGLQFDLANSLEGYRFPSQTENYAEPNQTNHQPILYWQQQIPRDDGTPYN